MTSGHCRAAWAGIVCAAAACLLPASVPAAEFTWNGSESGDWGDNSNWETNPTFASGNVLVFRATTSGDLNTFLGDLARTIGGLTFNDNVNADVTIRTYSNATGSSGSNRVLTFNGGAGDATITIDESATGNITIAPGGGRVALGSNLVVDHSGSGNLEIVNWIGGKRSITKNGTGTFTLSSNNTSMDYENLIINDGKVRVAGSNSVRGVLTMTGGTFSTIGSAQLDLPNVANFSGDLAFGDATDSGLVNFQAASTVTLVGDTTFNTISTLAFPAAIGESGGTRSLTKTGDGIMSLSNNSTFSGGLNINGGTVNATNQDGRLGAAGGAVSFDGGALSFVGGVNANISRATTLNAGGGTIGVTNAGVTINWTGAFTGTGGLTKTGPGTLAMDSVHSFSGGLNLNEGVYSVLNNDNRLGAAGGAVSFDGGTLLFRGGGSQSLADARTTTLDAGGGTIDVLNPVVTMTWAGAIGGAGGLTKTGSGGLALAGANTFTGPTAVNAGSLLINGTTAAESAVSVAAGATIGGTGTIGGATAISGILAPGDAGIGTLTIANNFTWNGGQNWLFELGTAGASLASPGTSDLLAITGGSNFLKGSGSSWTFDFAGTGDPGWYRLATWTGGSTDFVFGDFTATNLGGGNTGEFVISGDALYIQVVPEPSTFAMLGSVAAVGFFLARRRARR